MIKQRSFKMLLISAIFVILFYHVARHERDRLLGALFSRETADAGHCQFESTAGVGRKFDANLQPLLEFFGLGEAYISNVDEEELRDAPTIFVSASTDDYFDELLLMIESWTTFHSGTENSFTVYDIGLRAPQRALLGRKFPFIFLTELPPRLSAYARNPLEYRFKPIAIANELSLRPQSVIWWVDAAARWKGPSPSLQSLGVETSSTDRLRYPVQLFMQAETSIFASTNPGMYTYLPADVNALKSTRMQKANAILIVPTKSVREDVLKWWVLCALEKECMIPPGSKHLCLDHLEKFKEYADCHKFDESALNILLGNANDFNQSAYFTNGSSFIHDPNGIERFLRKNGLTARPAANAY